MVVMNSLPHQSSGRRAPRVRLENSPSTVLRFENGRLLPGTLQVVSLTGGLLNIPEPQRPGSLVKLMFMAQTGPVLCAAEMLKPVSAHRQPFRVLSLGVGDQRRLRATIDLHAKASGKHPEEEWIEKYRAAISPVKRPRKGLRRMALAAMVLGVIGVASVMYALNTHLLK
jgi:hypothetical protein